MKLKRLFAGILAVAMMATMAAPAFATGGGSQPSDGNTGSSSDSSGTTVTATNQASTSEINNTFNTDGKLVLNKQYRVLKGTAPTETFSFELTYVTSRYRGTNVNAPNIESKTYTVQFNGGDSGTAGKTYNLNFTISKNDLGINGAGQYVYRITEEAGKTQATTYDSHVVEMVVTVTHPTDSNGNTTDGDLVYTVTLHRGNATDISISDNQNNKIAPNEAFINYYGKSSETGTDTIHSLSLTKQVKGGLGDINKYFPITITLKGESNKTYGNVGLAYNEENGTYSGENNVGNPSTATITGDGTTTVTVYLKRNGKVTLSNIPNDVKYKIEEVGVEGTSTTGRKLIEKDASNNYPINVYSVTGEVHDLTAIEGDTDVAIINTHDGVIDTGVILDNAPYIALLLIAAAGAVVMVVKKRRHED